MRAATKRSISHDRQLRAPVRIGIVGLGLAASLMGDAIREHPDTIVAAAAEPDAVSRERFEAATGLAAYPDIATMLTSAEIDAVYIAAPHPVHAELTIAAARSGKHILVEKPMALSLRDCDAMIDAAIANNVALLVGHTHGFDPAIGLMRELIATGRAGSVRSLTQLNYTNFLYRPRRPDELDTERGGGIVYNQLPHQIDIARLLIGSAVRSVRAGVTRLDPARPTEGGCTAFLDFDNGATATITYSGYDRYDSDDLSGWIAESGRIKTPQPGAGRRRLAALANPEEEANLRRSALGFGAREIQPRPEHQPRFGFLVATCDRADLRASADGVLIFEDQGVSEIPVPVRAWRPGQGDVLEELCAVVRDGKRSSHDGRFGRDTLEVTLAILKSARERHEIMLPLEFEA